MTPPNPSTITFPSEAVTKIQSLEDLSDEFTPVGNRDKVVVVDDTRRIDTMGMVVAVAVRVRRS